MIQKEDGDTAAKARENRENKSRTKIAGVHRLLEKRRAGVFLFCMLLAGMPLVSFARKVSVVERRVWNEVDLEDRILKGHP